MKKFPIICPKGSYVAISQEFRPTNNPSHDAVDFVIKNSSLTYRENFRLTYGSQLVCPVEGARVVKINDYGSFNELGNGVDIEWQEGEYWYQLHFWHVVFDKVEVGDILKEGQIIAYMGNTGFVNPIPTPYSPYNGTHCHMRLTRFKKNQWGNTEIVVLDPTDYFSIYNPYDGEDSDVSIDLEPVKWAWLKLGIVDNFGRFVYLVTNIFN